MEAEIQCSKIWTIFLPNTTWNVSCASYSSKHIMKHAAFSSPSLSLTSRRTHVEKQCSGNHVSIGKVSCGPSLITPKVSEESDVELDAEYNIRNTFQKWGQMRLYSTCCNSSSHFDLDMQIWHCRFRDDLMWNLTRQLATVYRFQNTICYWYVIVPSLLPIKVCFVDWRQEPPVKQLDGPEKAVFWLLWCFIS